MHTIRLSVILTMMLGQLMFVVNAPARTLSAQEKLMQRLQDKAEPTEQGATATTDADQGKVTLQDVATDGTTVSDERLRDYLREYSQRYPALMGVASTKMRETVGTHREKRNAIMWQYSNNTEVMNIAMQPNPRVALIDLVTYTTRAAAMLKSDEGKELLGPYQGFFADAMVEANKWAWWLAKYTLSASDYDAVNTAVLAWSEKNPMVGILGRQKMGTLAGDRFSAPPSDSLRSGGFFSGVSSGIDSTVTELQQANRYLDNFYVLMDWMPVYAYWTAEIGFYNFLDSPEGKGVVDFANKLGDTQMRLGKLADYFENINRVVEPIADKMEEPEYADLPEKILNSFDRLDEISGRLLKLENNVNSLINDADGEPLGIRIASMDSNIEKLTRISDEIAAVSPAINQMGSFAHSGERLINRAFILVAAAIVLFFVCLFIYQFLLEKIRAKKG